MTYIYALHCIYDVGFPGGSGCKESACNAGDPGLVPGLGKSPGERNGSLHSSVLAWRIPWTEEPGGLWSMGLQRVDMTERRTFLFTSSTTYTYIYTHIYMYIHCFRMLAIVSNAAVNTGMHILFKLLFSFLWIHTQKMCIYINNNIWSFPGGAGSKEPACNA